jgi:sortase A
MSARTRIREVERIFLVLGLLLVALWGVAQFYRFVSSRAAIDRFHAADQEISTSDGEPVASRYLVETSDFRLWSNNRIAAYRASLSEKKDSPLGVLRIRKIDLQVPVFDGTDDLTLDRGVGRITGTARIGQVGNLGIAGHRDGFFRGLKDLAIGDPVELELHNRIEEYVVRQIRIVTPEDVSVLDPTPTETLTLVTCFPFYYIGNAPQRYVITAKPKDSSLPN